MRYELPHMKSHCFWLGLVSSRRKDNNLSQNRSNLVKKIAFWCLTKNAFNTKERLSVQFFHKFFCSNLCCKLSDAWNFLVCQKAGGFSNKFWLSDWHLEKKWKISWYIEIFTMSCVNTRECLLVYFLHFLTSYRYYIERAPQFLSWLWKILPSPVQKAT